MDTGLLSNKGRGQWVVTLITAAVELDDVGDSEIIKVGPGFAHPIGVQNIAIRGTHKTHARLINRVLVSRFL